MRINLSLAVFFLGSIGLVAQPPGFIQPADEAALKKKLELGIASVKSIFCAFKQEKQMALLEEKAISEGKFAFEQPGKVRLEYEKPYSFLMVVNGEHVAIREGGKESKGGQKAAAQIRKLMVAMVDGSMLKSKDFKPVFYESTTQVLAVVTPNQKMMREFFDSIEITFDKADWTATNILFNERGGDFTRMAFHTKKINTPLDPILFNPR